MFVTFDEVQRPVWVVTGASSGVGQAIALEAVQSLDAIVFAIGRTEEALKPAADAGCRAVPLNVAGPAEAVTASLNYVLASVGKIDVLVNAAGYLLEGAVEETRYCFIPHHIFLKKERERKRKNTKGVNIGVKRRRRKKQKKKTKEKGVRLT